MNNKLAALAAIKPLLVTYLVLSNVSKQCCTKDVILYCEAYAYCNSLVSSYHLWLFKHDITHLFFHIFFMIEVGCNFRQLHVSNLTLPMTSEVIFWRPNWIHTKSDKLHVSCRYEGNCIVRLLLCKIGKLSLWSVNLWKPLKYFRPIISSLHTENLCDIVFSNRITKF